MGQTLNGDITPNVHQATAPLIATKWIEVVPQVLETNEYCKILNVSMMGPNVSKQNGRHAIEHAIMARLSQLKTASTVLRKLLNFTCSPQQWAPCLECPKH